MGGNPEDDNINENNIFNIILKSNGKILGKYASCIWKCILSLACKKILKSINRGFVAKDSFNIVY